VTSYAYCCFYSCDPCADSIGNALYSSMTKVLTEYTASPITHLSVEDDILPSK
jgi:hypothetical protein